MYKDLIERLRKETYWLSSSAVWNGDRRQRICDEAADAIEKLQAERDAAVADLTAAGLCDFCGHWNGIKCKKRGKCHFKWRGLEGNNGRKD